MMNNIFRDLINKGDVATFIDDMLVGTETEERHDELVEEILRRLEEYNLYVKPEKCEWKVREVGFLGIVIGPDGERCKRGFSCYKQIVKSSGSSPQSRAKGSRGRVTERDDKSN